MSALVLAAVLGTVVASLSLWTQAIARWRAGQPLLPGQPIRPVPWGLTDLAMAFACWILVQLLALAAVESLYGVPASSDLENLDLRSQKILLFALGVANLVTCLVFIGFLRLRYGVRGQEVGWSREHLAADLSLGLQAFAMLAPLVYGLQVVLTKFVESRHPLIEMVVKNRDPWFFAAAAFTAVVVAPIVEEFLFRVLLQGWLERVVTGGDEPAESVLRGGGQGPNPPAETPLVSTSTATVAESPGAPSVSPDRVAAAAALPETAVTSESPSPLRAWVPIACSAALFALSHWSHGPDPIPLFVFAVGLGYLFQRTRRIMPCIVLHLLLNLCSLIALALMGPS